LSQKIKKSARKYWGVYLLLAILIIYVGPQLFYTAYTGGWEVRSYAARAKAVGKDKNGLPWDSGWNPTSTGFWKHDFDAQYHGAPDLIVKSGLDPVHVNKYWEPVADSIPAFDPIVKKTTTREYIYDVHLYKQDITLQVAGDHKTDDDFAANSIESESSYSHDRAGDYGSHDYYVQFEFVIDEWSRFAEEANSWAGVMSIFLWTATTTGFQEWTITAPGARTLQDLEKDLYGEHTEVIHNVLGQGDKLNMFYTDTGSVASHQSPDAVSPDSDIPQSVIFELWAQFRCGAVLGRDTVGNIEQIFVLNPYAVYHVAFEVMTVHEFYLESEPVATITQAPPQTIGVAPTAPKKFGLPSFADFFPDFLKPYSGMIMLAIILVGAYVALKLVLTIYKPRIPLR
jgi:hypothetical protein